MRSIVAAIVLLATTPLHGGIVLLRSDGSRVSIEGSSIRIDAPPSPGPHTFTARISRDDGATRIDLNADNRTWYRESESPQDWMSIRFGSSFNSRMRKPNVDASAEPGEWIVDHATVKHVIRITYDLDTYFDRARVRSKVAATFMFWSAPDLPAGIKPSVVTPFPEVNEALNHVLGDVVGLVLRQSASVTQTYAGGPPMSDVRSWTTESLEEKPLPASLFEIPDGYTHQRPQYGIPGQRSGASELANHRP